MRPDDVASGSAFRTAAIVGAVFTVAMLLVGISIYQIVESSLLDELDVQLTKEMTIFRKHHASNGLDSLQDAVEQLENPAIAGDRLAGLYDQGGGKLAGNIDITPGTSISQSHLSMVPDASGNVMYVESTIIATNRLIVGRNPEFLHKILDALLRTLSIIGGSALVVSLIVGWLLSHRSLQKLERISSVLERVSTGDNNARIGVAYGSSQIDRISRLIDDSLSRLSALMESTRNTTRAIAHDLRTPLNRAFILVREAAENQDFDALRDAEHALGNLASIFDTVLRISKLEVSDDRSIFQPVNFADVVSDVVDVFESSLSEKDQTVDLVINEKVLHIDGDRQMLMQLITNLLQNFCRHTPAGSQLQISIAESAENQVVLRIVDDGPGIPAESMTDILKPFHRLDASRTDEGSGLGLALVNAIAVRHGATIELSDNNPGLSVRITFPASTEYLSDL